MFKVKAPVGLLKKKKSLYDNDEEDEKSERSESNSSVGEWAVTDPRKFDDLANQSKFDNKRAPELWVPDGESKLIRFLDDVPITAFSIYRLKVNGKWQRYVKPPEGSPDLFASRLGLKASRVFVYRVIDIEGFTSKKKQTFTNVPRFLVAPLRMYELIKSLIEEIEDEASLSDINVKLKRAGQKTNTTYMFVPKSPSSMTAEMKKAASELDKDSWREYYRPLSKSEQKVIVARVSQDGDETTED